MVFTYKVTMDVLHRGVTPRLDAMQGDIGTRALELFLLADGTPWPIPTGLQCRVTYCKPDGTTGFYVTVKNGQPAHSIAGNMLTVYLIPELMEQAGPVLLTVTLSGSGNEVSSFYILLDVQPSLMTAAQ